MIICEGDADCRFYGAVTDALYEDVAETTRRPDVMFTHCGGKGRMPMVVRALRGLEVPIVVIADFDLLSEEQPLRGIVEAAGGDWNAIHTDWNVLKSALDGKKPELSSDEIKADLNEVLSKVTETTFPARAKKRIQEILRRSSPWSTAKSVGIQFVPNGPPSQACARLLGKLKEFGIFVVPVGELEGFAKTVADHGPAWTNAALEKDLRGDPELEEARQFVAEATKTRS